MCIANWLIHHMWTFICELVCEYTNRPYILQGANALGKTTLWVPTPLINFTKNKISERHWYRTYLLEGLSTQRSENSCPAVQTRDLECFFLHMPAPCSRISIIRVAATFRHCAGRSPAEVDPRQRDAQNARRLCQRRGIQGFFAPRPYER